jgi:hypothetical protein
MSSVLARFTKFRRLLADAERSRLAWVLVLLHAAWFLLTIANMHPPSREFANYLDGTTGSTATIFAGRSFHYHYESLSLQLLMLFDLPSWLASVPIGLFLTPALNVLHVGTYADPYVAAVVVFLMSSLQWLIIGKYADGWLGSRPWGVSTLHRINRHFVLFAVLILLITAVSAPLLTARSWKLQFRHSAISHH